MKAPKLLSPAPLAAAAVATLSAASGCSEATPSSTACTDLALERPMLVLESDRGTSSALGVLDKNGCFREAADVALGADPTLSQSAGRAFVNVRDQGVVLEVSADGARVVRTIPALHSGDPQPNPQDTAVDADGRLWISRYEVASAAVIAQDGSWAGTVDLSSLADADGIPEMSAVTSRGGRAYIAVEKLNRESVPWPSTGPGVIAVASLEPPFALEAPITLAGSNPFGRFVPALYDASGDTVTIVTPGNFYAIDAQGGVERIHLSSGEHDVLITETTLSGSAMEAVVVSETEGYAIVAGPSESNPTSVVRFDPSTGKVTQTLLSAPTFVHSGLAVNGPYVVVGDHTYGAEAIRVHDRATGAEIASVVPSVLPPISVITLDGL